MSATNHAPSSARLSERTVVLSRAAIAAIAAMMITFSQDHSAEVGLAVFSGFALATGLIFALAAWLSAPRGQRSAPVLLAVAAVLAGLASGIPSARSEVMFFVVIIAWAALSGIIELVFGLRARASARRECGAPGSARDAVTAGALTILLAVIVAFVRVDYAQPYEIAEANVTGVLTGITIAVGLFGGYAAIIAVFFGIAGFSPRSDTSPGGTFAKPAGARPPHEEATA